MPDTLRARVLQAVREHVQRATCNVQREDGMELSLTEVLAGAGEGLLARVKSEPGSRRQALTLLAADALMTYAMEAEGAREPHTEPR